MIRSLQFLALLFLVGCDASHANPKQNGEVKQMQAAWVQGYKAAASLEGGARIMAAELAVQQAMLSRSGREKLAPADAALIYVVFRDRNGQGLPATCAKFGAAMTHYGLLFALKDQSRLYPSMTAIDPDAYAKSESANIQAFAEAELELLAKSHGGDYKRACAWLDLQSQLSPEMSEYSLAMPIIFRTLVPVEEEQVKKALGGF